MNWAEMQKTLRGLARVVLTRSAMGDAETVVWVNAAGRDMAFGFTARMEWSIYFVATGDTVTGAEAEKLAKLGLESLPQYKHDCDECVFLGRSTTLHKVSSPSGAHRIFRCDLYFCTARTLLPPATLIQRYGDDGREYSSCPVTIVQRDRGSAGWGEVLRLYEAYNERHAVA